MHSNAKRMWFVINKSVIGSDRAPTPQGSVRWPGRAVPYRSDL